MARRYSHRPLLPNLSSSKTLVWLGYIINGSTFLPSVTFTTTRYGDFSAVFEERKLYAPGRRGRQVFSPGRLSEVFSGRIAYWQRGSDTGAEPAESCARFV